MTARHPASRPLLNGWRIAGWGSLLALLALPAIAMQLTGEVDWSPFDFAYGGGLLILLGIGGELAARSGPGLARRGAMGLASLALVLTCWVNGAVGIVGDEGNPLNAVIYVLAGIVILAASMARFTPRALQRLTLGMAGALLGLGTWAQLTGQPAWGPILVFALLWLASGLLFARARRAVTL